MIAGVAFGAWKLASAAWQWEPDVAVDTVPSLRANIALGEGVIHVRNDDSVTWWACAAEINSGIIRSGWTADLKVIGPGETVRAGLLAFTKGGGERFNPLTHAVQEVTVRCMTPSGQLSLTAR